MPELRHLKENRSWSSVRGKIATPRREVEVTLLLLWSQHDNASSYLTPQDIILCMTGVHSCQSSLLGK